MRDPPLKEKLIEIKITKATLFLTESELLNNLPEHIIRLGLERGKAIKRWRTKQHRITNLVYDHKSSQ